ncbi:MAG: UvrB/UvrC motif-containing protein [Patescibacteria group bacterium]|nr:UvrB/UvrC motif-containing protein [Patescibacteria group bacterium]
MAHDISDILRGWDYQPDELLVRMIEGEDGRLRMQLRLDLGVLQLECDGRPDGQRPEGFESWLDYYERQQQRYDAANPEGPGYLLGAEDCARLWREGAQYYHRYIGFYHLGMYEPCGRDTARNLRLCLFIQKHAADHRVKLQFDQWRPYAIMMNTRARAMPLVALGNLVEGLRLIDEGINAVHQFLEEHGQADHADQCIELVSLQGWRAEVLERDGEVAIPGPHDQAEILRRKLDAAIAAEKFEEAARIRDEIRRLQLQP